jgi:hypothetical protein
MFGIDWLRRGVPVDREICVLTSEAEVIASAKRRAKEIAKRHPVGNWLLLHARVTVNNKGTVMTPLRALPEQVIFQVSVMRELMKKIEFAPVQNVVAAIEEMNEQIDLLEKTAKGTV